MQVECVLASGVDADHAAALCAALRAAGPPVAVRLHVVATTPASISARLDLMEGTKTGPRMDFNIIDRNLTSNDYDGFARDLLRFGLPD